MADTTRQGNTQSNQQSSQRDNQSQSTRPSQSGTQVSQGQPGQTSSQSFGQSQSSTGSRMPSQSESAANRSGNSALSGEQNISFRCKDVGYGDCPWETKGRDEKEVFNNIERHGREQHGLKEWTEDLRNKVRNAFNRRAA